MKTFTHLIHNIIFICFFSLITSCGVDFSTSSGITSSAKNITAFSLNGTSGVISGSNITVTMPFGTVVTGLLATFTTDGESVSVGATPQTSGVTPNNFSSPVIYTVTAADTTTQNYTVTVVAGGWTKQVGASGGNTYGYGISVDISGNSYVTGYTNVGISGQAQQGTTDYFIAKVAYYYASSPPITI